MAVTCFLNILHEGGGVGHKRAPFLCKKEIALELKLNFIMTTREGRGFKLIRAKAYLF